MNSKLLLELMPPKAKPQADDQGLTVVANRCFQSDATINTLFFVFVVVHPDKTRFEELYAAVLIVKLLDELIQTILFTKSG